MTSLDSILKSRDITLPTKVRLVKATGASTTSPNSRGNQKCLQPLPNVPWGGGALCNFADPCVPSFIKDISDKAATLP